MKLCSMELCLTVDSVPADDILSISGSDSEEDTDEDMPTDREEGSTSASASGEDWEDRGLRSSQWTGCKGA